MKIKPKSVLLNLPAILTFSDYHEIAPMRDYFNELIGGKLKIRSKELNYNGGYEAVFYIKQDEEYKRFIKAYKSAFKNEFENE